MRGTRPFPRDVSRVLAVGQTDKGWLAGGCIGAVVDAISFVVHEQASVPSLLRGSPGCAHETNPLAMGELLRITFFKPKDIDVDGSRCVWE